MNHWRNRNDRECRAAMRKPIYWQDGEAEKLIADAIAQGRVTRCPSGYAQYSARPPKGSSLMGDSALQGFSWQSAPRSGVAR